MKISYPGIGGGLGECVLCGECFAMEMMLGKSVKMMSIEGFPCELPLHEKCMETMESLRGKSWEELPDGPLRKEYAEVFAESK